MKRLLLDLGNSRLKVAWQQQTTDFQVLPANSIDQMIKALPGQPDQIWLSSVADKFQTETLIEVLANLAQVYHVQVPKYQHYLPTKYDPKQLGVDRWLAMLACYQEQNNACLVVDCGTAVTLDWVDASGEHQGGYILPGLQLMQQAVLQGTAIDWVKPDQPIRSLALESASAIGLGARHALAALVEKMLSQVEVDTELFIGGGDAGELATYLASSHRTMAHMVLKGLACLADLEASSCKLL